MEIFVVIYKKNNEFVAAYKNQEDAYTRIKGRESEMGIIQTWVITKLK